MLSKEDWTSIGRTTATHLSGRLLKEIESEQPKGICDLKSSAKNKYKGKGKNILFSSLN